jgi:hypothetical protein
MNISCELTESERLAISDFIASYYIEWQSVAAKYIDEQEREDLEDKLQNPKG